MSDDRSNLLLCGLRFNRLFMFRYFCLQLPNNTYNFFTNGYRSIIENPRYDVNRDNAKPGLFSINQTGDKKNQCNLLQAALVSFYLAVIIGD
jgi:hypothetical protein